jgi:dTMP kinase
VPVSNTIIKKLRGKFIVLDGPDGAGKSTQHKRLEADLTAADVEVVSCRDPGGTAIGDRIRSILLDHDLSAMDVNCETMLFMASRAQLVAEIIRPALAAGRTVLCDRFVSSTCAYQGAAGYDPRRVIELARYALDDLWPDATIILDVEPEAGFARIGRKPRHAGRNRKAGGEQSSLFAGAQPDAMEARPLEFHRRVRKLFLELPAYYPKPVVVVDASADADTVYRRILEGLASVTG